MSIVNQFEKEFINIPDWRTNWKIVLFESNNWGRMERMGAKEAQKDIRNKRYCFLKLLKL